MGLLVLRIVAALSVLLWSGCGYSAVMKNSAVDALVAISAAIFCVGTLQMIENRRNKE